MGQSSRSAIQGTAGLEHCGTEVRTQILLGAEVDHSAAKERAQALLDLEETEEPDPLPRLELDEYVDIAIWAKVLPQRRPEESKAPDPVLLTEPGQRSVVKVELVGRIHVGCRLPRTARWAKGGHPCARRARGSWLAFVAHIQGPTARNTRPSGKIEGPSNPGQLRLLSART